MPLSEQQREALRTLGNTVDGHDFIPASVLDELLSMELVYWRTPAELDFTTVGEKVYRELVGTVDAR